MGDWTPPALDTSQYSIPCIYGNSIHYTSAFAFLLSFFATPLFSISRECDQSAARSSHLATIKKDRDPFKKQAQESRRGPVAKFCVSGPRQKAHIVKGSTVSGVDFRRELKRGTRLHNDRSAIEAYAAN